MKITVTEAEVDARVAEQLAVYKRRGVSLPMGLVRGLARTHLEMTAHSRLGQDGPPVPAIPESPKTPVRPLPASLAALPPRPVVASVPAAVVADRARSLALIAMTGMNAAAEAECREAIHSGASVEEYRATIAARSIFDAMKAFRER